MTLAAAKFRAVVSLLSDPLRAHAAAGVLATEAKARNVLVSDLIAGALAPPPPPAPEFSDVADTIDTPIIRRINPEVCGLRAEILAQTPKAWLTRAPSGEVWLPKSQVEHHGEDAIGRPILIVPLWLARKKNLV
jgi:hypothetical protein